MMNNNNGKKLVALLVCVLALCLAMGAMADIVSPTFHLPYIRNRATEETSSKPEKKAEEVVEIFALDEAEETPEAVVDLNVSEDEVTEAGVESEPAETENDETENVTEIAAKEKASEGEIQTESAEEAETTEPEETTVEMKSEPAGNPNAVYEATAKRMNVFAEATSDSERVGRISAGDRFVVLATEGSWARIRTEDGLEGYVQRKSISLSKDQESFENSEEAQEEAVEVTVEPEVEVTAEPETVVDLSEPVEATEPTEEPATEIEEPAEVTEPAEEPATETEEPVEATEPAEEPATEIEEPVEVTEPAEEPAAETEEPVEVTEPAEESATETEEPVEVTEPTEEPATETEEPVEVTEPTEEPATETEEPIEVTEPAEEPATETEETVEVTVPAEDAEKNPIEVPADGQPVEPDAETEQPEVSEEIKLIDIREEADGLSPIIAQMPSNAEYTVLEQEGAWVKVQYGETVGYVFGQHIGILPEHNEDEPDNMKVTIFANRMMAVAPGDTITLTSFLEGFDNCEYVLYQWECNDGDGWVEIPDATEDTYSFTFGDETNHTSWRLRVISD